MNSRLIRYFSQFIKKKQFDELQITKEALEQIQKESLKAKKNIFLEIEIRRDQNLKGNIYIGYLQYPNDSKVLHEEISQFISEEDASYLASGLITFDESIAQFLFYPNIDLEWGHTPNPIIKRITANQMFTNDGKFWSSDSNAPYPELNQILELPSVLSLYASFNTLQIEFDSENIMEDVEKFISENLLTYFSNLYRRLDEL